MAFSILPPRLAASPHGLRRPVRPAALAALVAVVTALALAAPAGTLRAQGVDIIRGRVLGPDSLPLADVQVTATTLFGQVSRSVRTNRDGRYTISFPGGEGEYWVAFNAIGFDQRRVQVLRTADQEILIANVLLSASSVQLETFTVTERAPVSRGDTLGDVSGTETELATDAGFLGIDQVGDLSAMAAAVPGVQLVPGTEGESDLFSVLGLEGDQNNTLLNGMMFGETNVPRDAAIVASLAVSPYDVARGGFSGGQLTIRTRSGSNFTRRVLSTNAVAPELQWVDRAGVASAQEFTNISLGGAASGPIRPDVLFYNTSFQFDRRLNDLQTLLNSSDLGLTTAGVAPDSVARLEDILADQAIPFAVAGFPGQRISTRGSFLSTVDWLPTTSSRGSTYSLTATGNWSLSEPAPGFGGGAALSTPSREGTNTAWGGAVQLRHSGLLGPWGAFSETNVAVNVRERDSDPYVVLPSGNVRINSTFDDGTASVRTVGIGGAPNLDNANGNALVGFVNTLSWFSTDNRHRLKLTTELRRESYWQDLTNNQYGTFTFNSLGELEAGTPASFTRQLAPRRREASQLVGAVSLGDAWRPVPEVQVQYGVRVDGNRFLDGPPLNPVVEETFGANNADVPNRFYVSPRVGFSWTYGQADQLALTPGMRRLPRAVVRGGLGVFQNTPGAQFIGSAIDNTGLPSGLQALTCVGAASPDADWQAFFGNPGLIPTACTDGTAGTAFANSAPNVTFFDPAFAAPRAIRGNLNWRGAVLGNRFIASANLTWSRNINQNANVDVNFPGEVAFTLADEADRPVYVAPAAIVPTTGRIAWREARVTDDFGRVSRRVSDLASESRQLSLSLQPATFSSAFAWNATYVLTDVREQFYGFQSTVGDPFLRDWSPGTRFARHQLQYAISYNLFDAVRIGWFGNIRSGTPYTPQIGGDVNGDSYGNDRAFVYDPNATADPLLAEGMRSLLAGATPEARACLESQLGALAGRNSCTGPWTHTANLSISFNAVKLGLPQRATLAFQISNPLGAVDRLVNGADNLRGWGQVIRPDPSLLFVRGFDPAAQRFTYEVNERFGSTRLSESAFRQPVSITAILRFDVGPTRERQQLLAQLDRGRSRPGNKPSLQQLRFSATVGLLNPMESMLQQSDTLQLTRAQADSLALLNRRYVLRTDSIWTPVAAFLAELPDDYDRGAAYDRYRDAREATVDMLIDLAPVVSRLLTDAQRRVLPAQVQAFLDVRTLKAIRSGTAGQEGGTFGGVGMGGRGRGGRGR
jgi:hypothetical protein